MPDRSSAAQPLRRPSMDDVAAAAGVSKGAVSKVIRNAYGVSPAMRERVEAAIESLGYRPRIAARVMRGQSFTIGFEIPQLGNEFFTQVMEGAAESLAGTGYQLIIAPGLGELKGAPVLNALADRQVDGIIAISPEVTPGWLENLAATVPLVLLGRHDASVNYDTLTNDDARGVELLMDHLRGLGHERIAHLTVTTVIDEEGARAPHAIRLSTYSERMRRDGLEPRVEFCQASEADAYRVARELLQGPDAPTAIFGGNDTLAIGALRAVADAGLDESTVSVVGYDDTDFAKHPRISLTTIDQFGPQMGATAIDLLMQRIRLGRTDAVHHQVTPELRVRASSAARAVPAAA